MGFFSDLKEDLSQAVNELNPMGADKFAKDEEVEVDLGAMLENIENVELEPEVEAETEAEEVAMATDKEEIATPEPAKSELPSGTSDENAAITRGMKIIGDIISEGSVDILGSVTGNVTINGKLCIYGNIEGDSKAAEFYAEDARVIGEINANGCVKVGPNTVVIGNIFATSAVIAGAVKGDIDVKGPVILDTTAIVMGNIKSKSVQINNGAVIEGICSQCYAEKSPISFFDDYKKNKNM